VDFPVPPTEAWAGASNAPVKYTSGLRPEAEYRPVYNFTCRMISAGEPGASAIEG